MLASGLEASLSSYMSVHLWKGKLNTEKPLECVKGSYIPNIFFLPREPIKGFHKHDSFDYGEQLLRVETEEFYLFPYSAEGGHHIGSGT